ncbi:hypothetical protein BYT27DRAFT_7337882 [Phlegmacium glaucopus]|nr:hypothetical protein BYT27DRAFT_7337882 [Phlegmacium glaucopus]
MSSRHPHNFIQPQPKTYRLTLKAIVSFPFRLCNPPPAVGKVRSCGVTPLLNVRLEDVLDRKHLPPLGLKDFEEWLLFVELSPENLYFTLWLREYKQRYNQWKSQASFQQKGNTSHDFPLNWSSQYSSQLAMFYARAKQTFFTPGSEYELNLSSSLLAPFHQPDMPPYPVPDMFNGVAAEIYQTLEESLRRFVHAQFNNVGNNRVLCGLIAGILFSILGALPPIALNFAHGTSRWTRLSALPGLWIGLTILVSSLNGICLGVYVFGDLRQLRKFELSRPRISKPQPLPAFKRHSANSRPLSTNSILPIQHLARRPTTSHYSHSNHDHHHHDAHRPARMSSISSNDSHLSGTGTTHSVSSDDGDIQISPAYYDDDAVDAPTSTLYPDLNYRFPSNGQESCGSSPLESSFTATATASFILPFEQSDSDEEYDVERQNRPLPAHLRPSRPPFDFDSLPRRPNYKATTPFRPLTSGPQSHPHHHENYRHDTLATPAPAVFKNPTSFVHHHRHPPYPPESRAPTGFLERMQEKCTIPKWRLQTGFLESEDSISKKTNLERPVNAYTHTHVWHQRSAEESMYASSTPSNLALKKHCTQGSSEPSPSAIPPPTPPVRLSSKTPNPESKSKVEKDDHSEDMETKVRRRFRLINAVPAFAVPLTRVLSPVIIRAQWEIVVRSAIVAFLISWVVVGSLLAVPVVNR